jgi:hypothetical protein
MQADGVNLFLRQEGLCSESLHLSHPAGPYTSEASIAVHLVCPGVV